HAYRGDETPGTAPDTNNIIATVTDNLLAVGSGSIALTVTNAPPRLNLVSATNSIPPAHPAMFTGNFFDAGVRDSHTLTINWGDGSGFSTFNYPPTTTNFVVSHEFEAGPTNVTVQLTL